MPTGTQVHTNHLDFRSNHFDINNTKWGSLLLLPACPGNSEPSALAISRGTSSQFLRPALYASSTHTEYNTMSCMSVGGAGFMATEW